jgi:arginase
MTHPIVQIIGVPSDLGANVQGACMGPAAIRIAGLKKKIEKLGYTVEDLGDVNSPVRDSLGPEESKQQYLGPVTKICEEVNDRVYQAIKAGKMPLTLGGDHSLAIGSISGVSKYFKEQNKKIGLIWVDAHADMNTPQSSPSLNIHGMPLSVVLGSGHPALCDIGSKGAKIDPANVVLIGIRTIDDFEKEILRKSGISYFTMRAIDEKGMFSVMEQAISVASKGTDGIHVSFDIDAIDPMFAPGVSTPVSGGLDIRESHLILEMLFETKKVCSMDLVELNPLRDVDSKATNLAIDLILSALGKSIV